MLRPLSTKRLLTPNLLRADSRYISSTIIARSHQPNAPVELDPSYASLLKDTDMSIHRHKARQTIPDSHRPQVTSLRELEIFPSDSVDDHLTFEELEDQEAGQSRTEQKSPAAVFGSQRIGAVILPFELNQTITRLISESDKHMLRVDAKRLFLDETKDEAGWDTHYSVSYKSWEQTERNSERDGTAFASVALPAHYSAIYAVLDHLKARLGPTWNVERVLDWGSGAGSGLWAASHAFQKPPTADTHEHPDLQVSNSTVSTYVGIDKRMGLVQVARRLLQDVDLGDLNVSWQKSFHDENCVARLDGRTSIALSAFMISSLPTPLSRKTLVKEMWESGAEVIVLIDHNTTAGFECIAEARELLLRFGRKEMEDDSMDDVPIRGSHVVAPCPHDRACPLYHPGSTRLVCAFTQRMQRPPFVRKTKHSGIGHEDTGYSYVVIRRGARPLPAETKVGRLGEVGKRVMETAREKAAIAELMTSDEHPHSTPDSESLAKNKTFVELSTENLAAEPSGEELQAALRSEAYSWPRLVFPPLKKAGHIIIDGCTSEGKIMRMTIPKSQGKQPFYDARKSNWGDIFPHDPKNAPQERYQPKRAGDTKTVPLKGGDIGKRSQDRSKKKAKASYAGLLDDLKEVKRKRRRERRGSIEEEDDFDGID